MYTGYVVHAHEVCDDTRIANAIENFGYTNDDVICIGQRGVIGEVNTFVNIENILDRDFATPEEALEAYLALKNS